MKKVVIAAVTVAVLSVTSSVASAQVCVVGIFAAAISASAQEHRELTSKEAMTCGLSYLFDKPEPKKEKVAHRGKKKRKS